MPAGFPRGAIRGIHIVTRDSPLLRHRWPSAVGALERRGPVCTEPGFVWIGCDILPVTADQWDSGHGPQRLVRSSDSIDPRSSGLDRWPRPSHWTASETRPSRRRLDVGDFRSGSFWNSVAAQQLSIVSWHLAPQPACLPIVSWSFSPLLHSCELPVSSVRRSVWGSVRWVGVNGSRDMINQIYMLVSCIKCVCQLNSIVTSRPSRPCTCCNGRYLIKSTSEHREAVERMTRLMKHTIQFILVSRPGYIPCPHHKIRGETNFTTLSPLQSKGRSLKCTNTLLQKKHHRPLP